MSFSSLPTMPEIVMRPAATAIPLDVARFLVDHGWVLNGIDPLTNTDLYYKATTYGSIYCSWSEAIAYEFFRFLTIGSYATEATQ